VTFQGLKFTSVFSGAPGPVDLGLRAFVKSAHADETRSRTVANGKNSPRVAVPVRLFS